MFAWKLHDDLILTGSERSGLVSPVKSNTYEYGAFPSGGSNEETTTAMKPLDTRPGMRISKRTWDGQIRLLILHIRFIQYLREFRP